ncbi:MAG TPA: hypothetical protein VG889_03365 [Rhizomicrobium sp.]|nr:hypothetical protein [Rhizomicrobium sp.]
MKFVVVAALAACLLSSPALAKKDVPVLSGAYVYTNIESCISPGGQVSVARTTGVATLDPQTGTASLSGYHSDGQSLVAVSQNATYSNTKTEVTINGTTYKAFYGALDKKIATYLSFIGVEPGDDGAICSDSAWLSRK